MADLVFTSKPKDEKDKQGRVETPFTLDGVEYLAIKPSKHQFVRLAASAARRYKDVDRAAAVLEFLDSAISEESSIALAARLDSDDDAPDHLEFTDLLPVMEALVTLWGEKDGEPGPAKRPRR